MRRHLIANIDRREYLDPERFGELAAPAEWSFSGGSILQALALLLSAGHRGEEDGDLRVDPQSPHHALVGAWAGKRVIVAGEGGAPGMWLASETRADTFDGRHQRDLYRHARLAFTDISDALIALLCTTDPDHPLHDLDLSPGAMRQTKRGYAAEEWAQETSALEHLRIATLAGDAGEAQAGLDDLRAMWESQERRYAGDRSATRRRIPVPRPPTPASEDDAFRATLRAQLRARLDAVRVAKGSAPPASASAPVVYQLGDLVRVRQSGLIARVAATFSSNRGDRLYDLRTLDGLTTLADVYANELEPAPPERPAPPLPAPSPAPDVELSVGDHVVTRLTLWANDNLDIPPGHPRRLIDIGTTGTLVKIERWRGGVLWTFRADDDRTATGGYPLAEAFAPWFRVGDLVVLMHEVLAMDQSVVPLGTIARIVATEESAFSYHLSLPDGRDVRYVAEILFRHAAAEELAF